MNKIIVYSEINAEKVTDASLELISKAYELKLQSNTEFQKDILVEAVVIAVELDELSKQRIYKAGADRIIFIKDTSAFCFMPTIYSKIFIDYFNQNPSDVILFPASEKTRTLAPRITTLLDTGLVADCTNLELVLKNNDVKLASTRPTFGGELMATILSKKNPQCATVRPGTFKIKDVNLGMKEYFEFTPSVYEENRIKLLRSLLDNKVSASALQSAKIVLAGGYGIVSNNKTEYFDKLQKLSKILNATVACTRKVVDYGIMPSSSQVGQTGQTITPELYVAFGISGAIQHIMGMKNSKTIIAVNSDENADIFNYADYKIVADAKLVIDDMLGSVL